MGATPQRDDESAVEEAAIALNQYFISGIMTGNLKRVKACVENGAYIHSNNEWALRGSAAIGQSDIVNLLLDRGADIHACSDEALTSCAIIGDLQLVKLLLNRGASIHAVDNYVIGECIENRHLDMVQLLLDWGADVHADNDGPLRACAFWGHLSAIPLLLDNGADIHADADYALRASALLGHFKMVHYLLDRGADIHADADYALNASALVGHMEVVQLLLNRGANIQSKADDHIAVLSVDKNEQMQCGQLPGYRGTEFHGVDIEAETNKSISLEIVQLLVDRGADIHRTGALGISCRHGHVDLVKLLAAAGVPIPHHLTRIAQGNILRCLNTCLPDLLLKRGFASLERSLLPPLLCAHKQALLTRHGPLIRDYLRTIHSLRQKLHSVGPQIVGEILTLANIA